VIVEFTPRRRVPLDDADTAVLRRYLTDHHLGVPALHSAGWYTFVSPDQVRQVIAKLIEASKTLTSTTGGTPEAAA
jgi:hypothetical protein